jgi:diguanylate cyclase (GGDEF)-like protein
MLFLNRTLFEPMRLLLNSTHKIEHGEQIDIKDITTQDEMGYLLSSFYKMNEKVIQREATLTHKVSHDELTKLLNRESLYSSMDKAIENSKNNNSKIAVLFLDLNKFKAINDTLGHKVGDFLLIEAAKVFTKFTRSSDKVFRIGGDEFLILLENITDVSQVDIVINKILEALKIPVIYQDKELIISTSIGIAIFPDNGTTPDELVKASDVAMYAAKKDTTINYKYFDTFMKPENKNGQ